MDKRTIFVELCCGTKSMSKAAKMLDMDKTITLDCDEDRNADYTCDIMHVTDTHPMIEYLEICKKRGDDIMMHASPPCNDFSRMNTRGQRDIPKAMGYVKKALEIMMKYATVWTLENPATGLLWDQDFAKEHLKFTHDVDYCGYGGLLRKRTRFAFSDEFFHDSFKPRKCQGSECPSKVFNVVSGRMTHLDWGKRCLDMRIAIPEQLCYAIVNSMVQYAKKKAKNNGRHSQPADIVNATIANADAAIVKQDKKDIVDGELFVDSITDARLGLQFKVRWSDSSLTWEHFNSVWNNLLMLDFLDSPNWRKFKSSKTFQIIFEKSPEELPEEEDFLEMLESESTETQNASTSQSKYEIDAIIDVRPCLKFKVKWSKPYHYPRHDSWEPFNHVYDNAAMTHFLSCLRWRRFKRSDGFKEFLNHNRDVVIAEL